MPTRIEHDCTTGETREVEITGAELKAHKKLLATPDPELRPGGAGAVAEAIEATRAELADLKMSKATAEAMDAVLSKLAERVRGTPQEVDA
jgi:hypothetical protein